MRLCPKCKQEREDSQFLKNQHWCKPCRAEYMREFNSKNPDYATTYQKVNREKYQENSRRYEERHKDKRKIEKALYKVEHAAELKAKRNLRRRRLYKEDIGFRLLHLLRSRLLIAVKQCKSGTTTKKIKTIHGVGCTLQYLQLHIESLFKPGMTWDNHGNGAGKWNLDHIKPCASFDLNKVEDQLAVNHYMNLQPLWWEDNLSKRDKHEEDANGFLEI